MRNEPYGMMGSWVVGVGSGLSISSSRSCSWHLSSRWWFCLCDMRQAGPKIPRDWSADRLVLRRLMNVMPAVRLVATNTCRSGETSSDRSKASMRGRACSKKPHCYPTSGPKTELSLACEDKLAAFMPLATFHAIIDHLHARRT